MREINLEGPIEKVDTFEIVRTQIARILRANLSNLTDSLINRAKVYEERHNPWEHFRDATSDLPPIINVWFDSMQCDDRKGDTVQRQTYTGIYNIDVYTMGVSSSIASGHVPGDMKSSLLGQQAIRMVRNILSSSRNVVLQMQGTVWSRKFGAITTFQPQQDENSVQNITGARLCFEVTFNETSPQYEGEQLEIINIKIVRAENGDILTELEFRKDGD